MNILNKIMTKNPCYKEGKRQKTKGLMLHSVGCAQPSAAVFYNQWNKASYTRACVHAFIDANTGDIWQTLPWANYGWHGGTKEANSYYIGVEMCESQYITYKANSATFTIQSGKKTKAREDAKRAYNAAVDLFAYLCKSYGLNPLTAILSHNEGRIKGIASAHYDPEHYWQGLGLTYSMDGFRKAVKRKMAASDEKEEEKPATIPMTAVAWAREIIAGKHGNGHNNRKASLQRAGCKFDYETVRELVNDMISGFATIYTVKAGDTLYGIARAKGVSYTSIVQMNGVTEPDKIYAGQEYRIK